MLKVVLRKLKSHNFVSFSIFIASLALFLICGNIISFYYSTNKEISIIAKRHYGDLVISCVLNNDGKENPLDNKTAQNMLEQMIRDNNLPTYIDTRGFSKPGFYSGSEYAATFIPYKEEILPFLENSIWYSESIGRHLRLEWFYSGGAVIVIDEGSNDIMLSDVSGVDFKELISFDYSFKDYPADADMPEHGIFISEYVKGLIEKETGKELKTGDEIKIGYPSFGIDNPRLSSCFYLPFLGVIPDTGGKLNNGTEARSMVSIAYVDTFSFIRLFQLDAAFSTAAYGNHLPLKSIKNYNIERPAFTRNKASNDYKYNPNQVCIRIKKGFDKETVKQELQDFLDTELNKESQIGRYTVFDAEEFLGMGAAGTTAYQIIKEQEDSIRWISIILLSLIGVILIELLYLIYEDEYQTILFFRTLGANRTSIFEYCTLLLSFYIGIPMIVGLILGAISGVFFTQKRIGFALFPYTILSIAITLFIVLLISVSFILSCIYLRKRKLSQEVVL